MEKILIEAAAASISTQQSRSHSRAKNRPFTFKGRRTLVTRQSPLTHSIRYCRLWRARYSEENLTLYPFFCLVSLLVLYFGIKLNRHLNWTGHLDLCLLQQIMESMGTHFRADRPSLSVGQEVIPGTLTPRPAHG